MTPFVHRATPFVVLATLVGCARKAEGDFDPDPGVVGGPPLAFVPELTEGATLTKPGGGGAGGLDSDGDGIPDAEEEELGLDPALADSDGDSFDDGVELEANSDPLDPTHHPYAGGWAIDPCNDDLVVTGNSPGSVTEDFALLDQHGELVRLHDFCAREVLLVTSAMWCEPCRDEAPHLQEWYETYQSQGFIVLTLLGEDTFGDTPDQSDLESWANSYGLEHPVLADANWAVSNRWPGAYIPTMHLLGAGATVIAGNTYVSETQIQLNLP
jgi:peroxiredoxin